MKNKIRNEAELSAFINAVFLRYAEQFNLARELYHKGAESTGAERKRLYSRAERIEADADAELAGSRARIDTFVANATLNGGEDAAALNVRVSNMIGYNAGL